MEQENYELFRHCEGDSPKQTGLLRYARNDDTAELR